MTINTTKAQNEDSLLFQLQQAKEDTNKVNLLRNIGAYYANQDPRTGIAYFKQAVVLSYKLNYTKGLAKNYINIGTCYSFLSNMDSTIMYADSGIKYSKIVGDPERLALVYLNKGDGYRNLGNFESAMLYCDTASMYAAKTANTDRQARIYSIISSIYIEQLLFKEALLFGRKALHLFDKDSNSVMVASTYDDFANIYLQMGKPDTALYYQKQAVAIGEAMKDYKDLSTYYFTLAQIYLEKQQYKEAEKNVTKAIQFGADQQNNNQLSSSYKLLGSIYLKQGRWNDAETAAKKAHGFITEEVSLLQQMEISLLLAKIYDAKGDDKNAYKYLNISSILKDSVLKEKFNQQVAKLQSSFQLKEKDKEIMLLAKDKLLQQERLRQQRFFIIAALLLFVLAISGVFLIWNRNKLKQRMKELELRNQIAADLHDEVGSSLSSIHLLSQMAMQPGQSNVQKNILEKMSANARETMEKMSDLVWTIKPEEAEGSNLKQRMERFAYEICSTKNITVHLQLDKLDTKDLNMEQRKNMYLIFKEALNNAVKYSNTEKMHISAENGGNVLTMMVKDEGKGFDIKSVIKGNGLENIHTRAASVGGTVTVHSEEGIGTTIKLVMPLTL